MVGRIQILQVTVTRNIHCHCETLTVGIGEVKPALFVACHTTIRNIRICFRIIVVSSPVKFLTRHHTIIIKKILYITIIAGIQADMRLQVVKVHLLIDFTVVEEPLEVDMVVVTIQHRGEFNHP